MRLLNHLTFFFVIFLGCLQSSEIDIGHAKLSLIKDNIYYYKIKSNHGHDAFFIEFDQIKNFLKDCYKE